MGLFQDERLKGSPLPRGIGFSGLSRTEPLGNIDYSSFACGGCHIGRVRLPDGSIQYLDGGINTQFNVIGFRKRLTQTLTKIYQGETDPEKKQTILTETFLNALEQSQTSDPHFFYKNYQFEGRHFDAEYEKAQITLFRQQAATVIPDFASHAEQVYKGWGILVDRLYPEIKSDIMSGFPGMEDAIAFNAVNAYFNLQQTPVISWFAPLALPSVPGITDIMAVWYQDAHDPRWNEEQSDLINGGGQWNGHIPLPIYKNIAAQLTLGFDNIDIRVSAFSEELLKKLPPAPYPFDVDISLAKKGQKLFTENCASCHQPNNGKVYKSLGTNMGRAKIAGTLITLGARSSFTSDTNCSVTTEVEMYGNTVKPCAEYRGVSLTGKSRLAMTSPKLHDGYNALPLVGIWAQAPYLHNGSVPTLYHLLMPGTRPDRFMKARLDYDPVKVGYSWQPDLKPYHGQEEGYLFKPASSPAISNKGHDTDIVDGERTYRLDWSKNEAGAMAIIEYLKTL
ncbi:cytochrome C [Endozoicomonas numazuensis]|uniref:Cytochrome C n=2 Tax=Endozoicomonas numazuensis TaxID=1137799 RepID=A0A081NHA4_9GAMM|nr:cytochrome C [Endozoicomonas numazuensis]